MKLTLILLFSIGLNVNAADKITGADKKAVKPAAKGSTLPARFPNDDSHNHDGTHVDGQQNCDDNYMLPGNIARLGSHSFMILGPDDDTHVWAEHRSGTPPHDYQFLFRVRLDKDEMDTYRRLLSESKTLPAFTTIWFDGKGKQLDRTFFCLQDLPKIFGSEKKKGDAFEKLFPIRASLQKNADHEGSFDIGPSIYGDKYISLNRDDIELRVYRYIPQYLPQDDLRMAIKKRPKQILPLLSDAPISIHDPVDQARKRASYMKAEGSLADKTAAPCARNYYLKNVEMYPTIHSFLILSELDHNTVLATHYYDYSPQNFQTVIKIKLSDEAMALYRKAKEGTDVPPLFQTRIVGQDGKEDKNSYFCMDEIRDLIKSKKFMVSGTLYKGSQLAEYKLGAPVGTWDITAADVEVLVNRKLESLMDPLAVVKDMQGGKGKH